VRPQKYHRELLNKLSLSQLEEALRCLHNDQNPKDKVLQKLQVKDWGTLHELLVMLFKEKEESSLH
jgi:hypothetical protein